MAGYFLYSIDRNVFQQLVTTPTTEQGLVLADHLLDGWDDLSEEFEDKKEAARWPRDRNRLAAWIIERLAKPDWYSDLPWDSAQMWDNVVRSLQDEPGEAIGVDFQCYDYESIYWDCAEIAAAQGAAMMAEPTFGSSGFRYFGKPSGNYSVWPMYSLYLPEQSRALLDQLLAVEPHFATLENEEGSPREQFFEGLLPPVRDCVQRGRVLWVQTDT